MNINEAKALDEALDYLNEGLKDVRKGAPYNGALDIGRFVKDLFKKPDKKKKEAPVKNKETKSSIPSKSKPGFSEDELDLIVKNLKTAYNKMKTTKEFKDKCLETSKKYNDDLIEWNNNAKNPYPYSENELKKLLLKDGYVPSIHINLFEDGGDYAIIEVIDDEQSICIDYSWILYDLTDKYNELYPDNQIGADYGDGDEGCLYI
jgi:hypothetical protein